jgi:Na+-transporting methylmalonyl-CoA/oxaloacetate decarboxylase beta subunit
MCPQYFTKLMFFINNVPADHTRNKTKQNKNVSKTNKLLFRMFVIMNVVFFLHSASL